MESSSGMTVRALITLAFLVLVPLAAIFGTRFAGGVSAAKQAAPAAANPPDPKVARPAANPPGSPAGQNPAKPALVQARDVAGSNFVAGANLDPAQNPASRPNLTNPAQPGLLNTGGRPTAWNPGQPEPARPGVNGAIPGQSAGAAGTAQASPPVAGVAATGDAATTDPFTWMQRRLRELGAIYYRLENGGPKGEMFRFQCQMAVPGSTNGVQPFEAIEGDPLKAMQRVLQQVEVWHSKLVR